MFVMIRKFALGLAGVLVCANLIGCNEKTEEVETTATNAAVRSFTLKANDKVLAHLDSVFFTVDLVKGTIFNADSMPYGTDITKLVPVITTVEGAGVAELTVRRSGTSVDTVYDYLTNSSDSIDFTNPVKLRLVSPDGRTERNYTINVNVHKVAADSLMWAQADRRTLPSKFAYPTKQHTVKMEDHLFCLTEYQSQWSMALLNADLAAVTGSSPDLGLWSTWLVDFGFTPNVQSFSATNSALYILDTAGNLYTSTDLGSTWASTGLNWHAVYGSYGNQLLGSVKVGNDWKVQSYPDGALVSLPDGMPVSGMSVPVEYTFSMSNQPQILMVGGRCADGTLSDQVWGYDGKSWARVSRKPLPVALEYAAVAPYITYEVNSGWPGEDRASMYVFGGRKSDGSISKTVYVSNDYGNTWSEGGSYLQLPDYIPAMYDSQVFSIAQTLKADAQIKVSRPVESWNCTYIYMYGGVNASGQTSNNVWRGVINRLSFKPII